ncbi:MAG: DUF6166 domain-containing protein [Gammaproteobacteria bacterium]|nr:DUF6166 domain-containing protein [Gammaproteobacteria bacterium]
MTTKHYQGDRTIDGIVVLVDGRPLEQRLDVRRFSENGFEWSYQGAAPRQLALALLADHLGDPVRAVHLRVALIRRQVAEVGNTRDLSGCAIEAALRDIDPPGPPPAQPSSPS